MLSGLFPWDRDNRQKQEREERNSKEYYTIMLQLSQGSVDGDSNRRSETKGLALEAQRK